LRSMGKCRHGGISDKVAVSDQSAPWLLPPLKSDSSISRLAKLHYECALSERPPCESLPPDSRNRVRRLHGCEFAQVRDRIARQRIYNVLNIKLSEMIDPNEVLLF
jgi:hypothetical protein